MGSAKSANFTNPRVLPRSQLHQNHGSPALGAVREGHVMLVQRHTQICHGLTIFEKQLGHGLCEALVKILVDVICILADQSLAGCEATISTSSQDVGPFMNCAIGKRFLVTLSLTSARA